MRQITIKFSNRTLYTIILIGVLIIFAWGVYAYGGDQPSVMGHSAGELDFSAGINTDLNVNGDVEATGTVCDGSGNCLNEGMLRDCTLRSCRVNSTTNGCCQVLCNPDEKVTGGGIQALRVGTGIGADSPSDNIYSFAPYGDRTWYACKTTTTTRDIIVQAMCCRFR